MRIHDLLTEALILIGRLQEAALSAGNSDEAMLWRHVREHVFFISRTGQDYRLEDYLASRDPARSSYVSEAFETRTDARAQQAMSLLLRTLGETAEPEHRQLVLVLIDTLNFIAASGQYGGFDDYLENHHAGAPPVIAHFETREEAERWLNNLPEPPSWANILIGDEHHEMRYFRDTGQRTLLRDNIIELFLEDFANKGLPPAVASFNTREEAEEWLTRHPASPMTFVTIAGEDHLAVHHKKLDHHSFHHVNSTLKGWEESKKQASARQKALEATAQAGEVNE